MWYWWPQSCSSAVLVLVIFPHIVSGLCSFQKKFRLQFFLDYVPAVLQAVHTQAVMGFCYSQCHGAAVWWFLPSPVTCREGLVLGAHVPDCDRREWQRPWVGHGALPLPGCGFPRGCRRNWSVQAACCGCRWRDPWNCRIFSLGR